MDLSRPEMVALVAGGIIAVLTALTLGLFARAVRVVDPATGRPGPLRLPLWSLVFVGFVVYLAVLVVALGDHPMFLGHPYPVGLALMAAPLLIASVVSRLARRYLIGDRLVTRVGRRADRGDRAGAIAELQAALDREAPRDRDPTAAPGPFDPWAPPVSGRAVDPRRAARLNLLGILHARGGDWPAALESFRGADRAGGGEPTYRLNMGESLIMLGNPGEGIHLATLAVDSVPTQSPLRRYELNLSLARTLLDAGHHPAAADIIERAAAALRQSPILRAKHRALLNDEVEAVRARVPAVKAGASPTPTTPGA